MNKRRIFALGIVIVIAILFWYSSVLQDAFYVIVNYFNKLVLYNESLAIILFLLISALAALISPFTNIPLIPVAVVIWGVVPTTILLLFGWLIGDIIAYFIGRYLGEPAIRYIVSADKFDNLVRVVKERTNFFTAFLLRLTLPAELGYMFGIIRYNFFAYLIITFFAELPFAIISTYTSDAILAGDTTKFFEFIGILCLILFGLYKIIHKKTHLHINDKIIV
jgi:uncharacterized membrane protein YdjX (TVP38/TMEM64 family)